MGQTATITSDPKSSFLFIENKGQITYDNYETGENILFKCDLPGAVVYVTNSGLTYFLYKTEQVPKKNAIVESDSFQYRAIYERVDLVIKNADIRKARLVKVNESRNFYNFYSGNPFREVLNVRGFTELKFENIYPGIDWVLRINPNKEGFKQDFIVHPNANYKMIELAYLGSEHMKLVAGDNQVSVITSLGEITEKNLISYSDGYKIESAYIFENNSVHFNIAEDYDRNKQLIIDPEILVWCTNFGGEGSDWLFDLDSYGDYTVILGSTLSFDFPFFDMGGDSYFDTLSVYQIAPTISLFDKESNLVWSTLVAADSMSTWGNAISMTDEKIIIGGYTQSENFPIVDPGGGAYIDSIIDPDYGDVFMMRFNMDGIMEWSTLIGGLYFEEVKSIYADSSAVWVTGNTASHEFPIANPGAGSYIDSTLGGSQDAFIMKFDETGILKWSTYYGGDEIEESESITANDNSIWVTGAGGGLNFDLYDPSGSAYMDSSSEGGDAFILQFDHTGVQAWATFYGGDEGDEIFYDVAANQDNVIFVGRSTSSDYPVYDAGGDTYFKNYLSYSSDIIITGFTTSGDRIWSTYYGGNDIEEAFTVTLQNDEIIVSGYTRSSDFFIKDPLDGSYMDSFFGGGVVDEYNDFILKFINQELNWSTFFVPVGFTADAIIHDKEGDLLWCAGEFDTDEGGPVPYVDEGGTSYFDNTHDAFAGDIFIAKFSPCFNLVPEIIDSGFLLYAPIAETYQWIDCATGELISGETAQSFEPEQSGIYAVIITNGSCRDTTECIEFAINNIEIIENIFFLVSPNPATNQLLISFNNNISGELVIYNLTGQIILRSKILNSTSEVINISNLIPGNYLIRFIDTDLNSASQLFTKLKSE